MGKGPREKLAAPPELVRMAQLEWQRRGWSQNRMAKECGVAAPSLSRMKKGEASWDTVLRVFRALGLPAPRLELPDEDTDRLREIRSKDPVRYAMIRELMKPHP
jgi:transcriptional regulator with XRE-family HTH domain